MNAISQFVVEALWVSFRSFPPKEAMVAFVWTDIVGGAGGGGIRTWWASN